MTLPEIARFWGDNAPFDPTSGPRLAWVNPNPPDARCRHLMPSDLELYLYRLSREG